MSSPTQVPGLRRDVHHTPQLRGEILDDRKRKWHHGMPFTQSQLASARPLQDPASFGDSSSERGYLDLQDLPDLLAIEQAGF
jgi:hypothetical protein